tara:strand:+ start:1262 stop:1423 length:162 start_codon:yes stop_codon:yes gene_type:complete
MVKSWITRKYLFVESLETNIPDYIGYFKVVVGVASNYAFVEKQSPPGSCEKAN